MAGKSWDTTFKIRGTYSAAIPFGDSWLGDPLQLFETPSDYGATTEPGKVYGVPDWLRALSGNEWADAQDALIASEAAGGFTKPHDYNALAQGKSDVFGGVSPAGWNFALTRGFVFPENVYNTLWPNWRSIEGLSKGGLGGVDISDPYWGAKKDDGTFGWGLAGVKGSHGIKGALQSVAPVAAIVAPFAAGWAAPALQGLAQGAGITMSDTAAKALIQGGMKAITSGDPGRSLLSSAIGYGINTGIGSLGDVLGSGVPDSVSWDQIGNDPGLGLDSASFANAGGDMWDGWDFGPGNFMDFDVTPDFDTSFLFDSGGYDPSYGAFFTDPSATIFDNGNVFGNYGDGWDYGPGNFFDSGEWMQPGQDYGDFLGDQTTWMDSVNNFMSGANSGASSLLKAFQSPLGRMGGSLIAGLLGSRGNSQVQNAYRRVAQQQPLPGAQERYAAFMANPQGQGQDLINSLLQGYDRQRLAGHSVRLPDGSTLGPGPNPTGEAAGRAWTALNAYMPLSQMYANQAQPSSAQLQAALAAAGLEGGQAQAIGGTLADILNPRTELSDPNLLAELGKMLLSMAEAKQR